MLNSLQGRECEIVFEHLRKDTISREGSFFYQPLSLTLSSAFARIQTHVSPQLNGSLCTPLGREQCLAHFKFAILRFTQYDKLFYIFNFSTISTTSLWTSSIDLVESTTLTLSGSDFAISR